MRAGETQLLFFWDVCRGKGVSLEWSKSNTTAVSAPPLLQLFDLITTTGWIIEKNRFTGLCRENRTRLLHVLGGGTGCTGVLGRFSTVRFGPS